MSFLSRANVASKPAINRSSEPQDKYFIQPRSIASSELLSVSIAFANKESVCSNECLAWRQQKTSRTKEENLKKHFVRLNNN